ncbi:Clan SB, family S8, subtilisin-like serine peptidase [Trichomonas vaginalis G3]|uniref:Clan SB, family S8, subtilisin-like serine peptidase n=1 Tax=Trichomonas vaginalis (strain ATCC PRA-98 / G3) TaxID=412133 RepID=A2DGA0_TRIV3|nr:peptidase S8 family [Trichomonas vaginalis G3]EAY20496.1 Clan SB, family S8, subtilisin-like serine peptidase [Trichomonas vaginalis G3]KAI5488336.1 peptidase S8 family [Trichomonas vaginalis G3]|eukprot:XP_001581482.1 Clan SB, family S8, subtilisin-like serine peptidase [Trichomonas vaginalis G3]
MRNNIALDDSSKEKISKHDASWYYVRFEEDKKYQDVLKALNLNSSQFKPIEKGFYSVFLSQKQALTLKNKFHLWIKKIPSKDKYPLIKSTKNITEFYVLHTENCKLPGKLIEKGLKFSRISFENNEDAFKLLSKTHCVRSFEPVVSRIQFQTRFNKELLNNFQDKVWKPQMSEYETGLPYFFRRYTGKDQCVLMADSGIDTSSIWLSDPTPENNIFGFNRPHRKVKKYISYADYKDDTGHGTFLAGLMVGRTFNDDESKYYNGIAPDAKIVVADISQGDLTKLPSNIADLSRDAQENNCTVQMNAWTQPDQPLLTYIMDEIAYDSPNTITVFPGQADEFGYLETPADAKNVLTVGAVYGNMVSKSVFEKNSVVYIYPTGLSRFIAGIVDESGPSLFNVTNTNYIKMTIDSEQKQVCVMNHPNQLNLEKCKVILYFGEEKIKRKFQVPVIRLPSRWRGPFQTDLELSIVPADTESGREDERYELLPKSAKKVKYPGRIKPEIVAPGGPMTGPKAGARIGDSTPNSLTTNQGTSVAASMISAYLLVLAEYFKDKQYNTLNTPLAKALLVASADDIGRIDVERGNNTQFSSNEPGYGFGLPRMERIVNNLGAYQKNVKAYNYKPYYQCFSAHQNEDVEIAISWLDKPRDPYSPIQITTPLIAWVSDAEEYHQSSRNQINSIKQNIDRVNNIIKIKFKAERDRKYHLKVVPDSFESEDHVEFSYVILGDVSLEMSCTDITNGCPKQCQNGGTCQQLKCQCFGEYRGDFCQYKINSAYAGVPIKVDLPQNNWAYYSLALPKWEPGSSVVFDMQNFDEDNFDFLIRSQDIPTHSDYFCSYAKCDWGIIDRENKFLTIKYEQWDYMKTRDPIFIGVYARSARPTNCTFIPVKLT